MDICYRDWKDLNDKLDSLAAAVGRIESNSAETAELRAEIAALIAAAEMADEAKAALQVKVEAALQRSERVETKLRSAIPNSP